MQHPFRLIGASLVTLGLGILLSACTVNTSNTTPPVTTSVAAIPATATPTSLLPVVVHKATAGQRGVVPVGDSASGYGTYKCTGTTIDLPFLESVTYGGMTIAFEQIAPSPQPITDDITVPANDFGQIAVIIDANGASLAPVSMIVGTLNLTSYKDGHTVYIPENQSVVNLGWDIRAGIVLKTDEFTNGGYIREIKFCM